MLNEKNSFFLESEDGKKVKCDVLFTFDSEETGKSYIVYTDNTVDSDGRVQVYASTYIPDLENQKLQPIETEKEWKIIETILETLQQEIKSRMNGTDRMPDDSGQEDDPEGISLDDNRVSHVARKIMKMKNGDDNERLLGFELARILGDASFSEEFCERLEFVEETIDLFYQSRQNDEA